MKSYTTIILEYVLVALAFSWLIWNEFRDDKPKSDQHKRVSKENSSEGFVYPPLPTPFKGKVLRSPNYDIPLILVGGHPRSGTTLMRSMLDAHDMVRCGEETHIIPTVANMWDPQKKSNDFIQKYAEVGLTQEVLDRGVANFLIMIIYGHGASAARLCNKDPLTMLNAFYINRLFPKSKFIFMIRDGRATIHSVISRQVGIGGFDLRSYEKSLRNWNDIVQNMYEQCEKMGPQHCHPVYYEELILQPRKVMKNLLQFLELPWRGEVLRHEEFVDKEGGIKLNPKEPSTNQVSKARYEDALTTWVGKIPTHLLDDMDRIAPMLSYLGYDPSHNPPSYGNLKYRWGQTLSESCIDRTSERWFISAVYHKTNDSKV